MFLNSLGLAHAMIDDYSTAYIHMKEALQILLVALGANHIEVCDVYSHSLLAHSRLYIYVYVSNKHININIFNIAKQLRNM